MVDGSWLVVVAGQLVVSGFVLRHAFDRHHDSGCNDLTFTISIPDRTLVAGSAKNNTHKPGEVQNNK